MISKIAHDKRIRPQLPGKNIFGLIDASLSVRELMIPAVLSDYHNGSGRHLHAFLRL